jgi:hypothetical protein
MDKDGEDYLEGLCEKWMNLWKEKNPTLNEKKYEYLD